MFVKPDQKLSVMLAALFVLLLVGMSQHVHSLNSYHDGNDCYHVAGLDSVTKSSHDIVADTHDSFAYSPVIAEGELIAVSSFLLSPIILTVFSLSRAPPA